MLHNFVFITLPLICDEIVWHSLGGFTFKQNGFILLQIAELNVSLTGIMQLLLLLTSLLDALESFIYEDLLY